jgi:hypothetical protein
MSAKKFLRLVSGKIQEIVAVVASAGAANDGDLVALDATGRLDMSVMPAGVGGDIRTVTASEALSAGSLVNLYSNAGTLNARKADASASGKEANGFVLSAVANGAQAAVYFSRLITGLSGLTVGARYFLDPASPGGLTATAPSGTGKVSQFVGTALSATELAFEPDDGIILA